MSFLIKTKSSYTPHELIKRFVKKQVLANDFQHQIYKSSLEKSFGERRADVFFYYKSGKKVVVEIQNSPMSSKEITARTLDYNKKGIFVLWILNGQGKTVGSPKYPKHEKDVKISPAELRLHQLYGGRVYYVNINHDNGNTSITKPFALHFSYSDKYSSGIFRKVHDSFFIRNVNYCYIPSWSIVVDSYADYKLARFYDKNLKYLVAEHIIPIARKYDVFRKQEFNTPKSTKRFLKIILSHLYEEYGKFLILGALTYLIIKKKLILNMKFLRKYEKKLRKKANKGYK
ncbi:MAG: competence protein CoiA family protein [Promethearchaeota archaeon]